MINIVTHPHTDQSYVDLFKKALRRPVEMGGDQRAMLGTCIPIGPDPLDGIQGSIFRYTNIDMNHPWLDMVTGKELDPEEVQKRINLPEHLKPNFSLIWYNFFPRTHKLVFELERSDPATKKKTTFSASTCQKFFSNLFGHPTLRVGYSSIEVTVVQNKETLKRILALSRLSKLEILINRPNSNDDEVEEELEALFEEEGVNRFFQELSSKEESGLKPSSRTQGLARTALSNGYVEASGRNDQGQKVHIKTVLKPVESLSYYDPKRGFGIAFTEAALKFLKLVFPK